MTKAQAFYEKLARDSWFFHYDNLSADEKKLLSLTFENITTREVYKGLKAPKKLINAAIIRALKSGKLEANTCSRCCGTGHYSYCQQHGTTCFNCGGSGKDFPSVNQALKAIT